MRTTSTIVDIARPTGAGSQRYRNSTWMWLLRRTAIEAPTKVTTISR